MLHSTVGARAHYIVSAFQVLSGRADRSALRVNIPPHYHHPKVSDQVYALYLSLGQHIVLTAGCH